MSPNVLIVDDNPADQELLALVLETIPFTGELHACSTAQEALKVLTEPSYAEETLGPAYPVELVILDLKMPGMNGFDLLEALPAGGPPVVVCSSSNDESDRSRATAHDCVVAYLTKPPTVEKLKSVLNDFTQSRDHE